MKKSITLLLAMLTAISIFSQAPEKMSYQALIRNSSNKLVVSSTVGMKISILQGSTEGTVVYTETQTPVTNANGLVNIEIGGGEGFSSIDWSTGTYFIKTETDPLGGTDYTIMGTSQLLSVPYALYSKNTLNAASKESVESIQQQLETLRDKLYTEFPNLNEPNITSEQILSLSETAGGSSVSISGNLAVIGAGWEHTDIANKAGAVYVFEFDGNQWNKTQRITNPNGSFDAIFGQSVATNGIHIVITEPNRRSAHIYAKSGSTWVHEKTFTVTNISSEKYGISCDIYENTVVIGSGSVFAGFCSAVGSAYVYEKDDSEWINTAILTPSGGLAHDCFGHSVSIYGNTIAVGACRASCYVSEQGYVSIFEKNGANWVETQRLVAPEGNGKRFGQILDMENNRLAISYVVEETGVEKMGVFYYEKETSWEFKQKINSPNLMGDDGFGNAFSLSKNYLLIGADGDDDIYTNQGAVYLYRLEGTEWIKKQKIIPLDAKADDFFGVVLSMNNNNILVLPYGIYGTKPSIVYVYKIK